MTTTRQLLLEGIRKGITGQCFVNSLPSNKQTHYLFHEVFILTMFQRLRHV